MATKPLWWAAGGGISRTGPFATQRDAYVAMRLTIQAQEKQYKKTGVDVPYPTDIVVWPEWAQASTK